VAGAGELPKDPSYPHDVIRRGEDFRDALAAKSGSSGLMESRLHELGAVLARCHHNDRLYRARY